MEDDARKDLCPDDERYLHRHVERGAEGHAPDEAGEAEIAIEDDGAEYDAEVVEDRGERVDQEAVVHLGHAGEEVGEAQEEGREQHDAHGRDQLAVIDVVGEAGQERPYEPRGEDIRGDRNDHHGAKEDREDRIDELAAFFFALLEIADEEGDQHGGRDRRGDGGVDQVRDAKSRIIEIQGVPRAEGEGQDLVADEGKDLAGYGEDGKKIRGLVQTAYLTAESRKRIS